MLLSGDEDLREGVRAAQDYGVRIVLIGIERTDGKGFNQSEELVLDADQLVTLGKSQLSTMFTLRSPVAARSIAAAPGRSDTAGSTGGMSARTAAAVFAQDWLSEAIEAEIADLHARRPRIPRPLDLELLTAVEQALGRPLLDDDTTRRATRSVLGCDRRCSQRVDADRVSARHALPTGLGY